MSEYIMEIDDMTAAMFQSYLGEEIVRCRDCAYYERMNDDEGMCMVPDDDGDYARFMVDDCGYCYLGIRSVDE